MDKINGEGISTKEICFSYKVLPKIFWMVYNTEIHSLQYKLINNKPVLTIFNNVNSTFKIYNLLGLEI